MSILDTLLSPKARARVIVRLRTPEGAYMVRNIVKGWGIPGQMRSLGGSAFEVIIEARQSTIRSRIDALSRDPLLATNSLQIDWLPYTGRFRSMTITF